MQGRDFKRPQHRLTAIAGAMALLAGASGAEAFSIPSSNEDISMRLDNTIGVTAAWRTGSRDLSLNANPALSADVASDYFADDGHLYSTRFDLFSEFDFKYKNESGFRLSGALWDDPKFPDHPKLSPATFGYSAWGPAGTAPQWDAGTKRYYEHSAELLDAFAFTRLQLGSVPVSIKLGRTSQVWGESSFGTGGAVSIGYGQNPNDGRKAASNPNASLKETSLPVGQTSLSFGISDNANLNVYTTHEWRPDRVPNSGTYMGFSDGIAGAPDLFCANTGSPTFTNFCLPYGDPVKGRGGDWGIQYKGRPDWLDASLGIAYRKFDEKNPWYAVWDPSHGPVLFGGFFPVGSARSVYGHDTEIIGLSLNKTLWDISWGAEVNYRKNAALVGDFSAIATPGAGGSNTTVSPVDGPRGNVWNALLNLQWFLGKAAFWDTFVIASEATITSLDSVTRNAQYFQGHGSGYAPVVCGLPNPKVAGCADSTSETLGIYLDPTTYQVFPSIDLDIPVFVQRGFGNNVLNNFPTGDGAVTISAGLKFTIATTWSPQIIQLNYLAFRTNNAANNAAPGHTIGGAPYYDRDQVQLTYTTNF